MNVIVLPPTMKIRTALKSFLVAFPSILLFNVLRSLQNLDPMPIRILPKHVANQIAAGEVVERPASIIKELVENSIDSGAKSITVKMLSSGISRITVLDDGIGMDEGDLEMSVKRHATSKLNTLTDLDHIASLGFRGEALASIASVSKLVITSRKKASNTANKIEVHGGTLVSKINPAAGNYGTFVSVSELFYNTPARKKFLKSMTTEMRHIKMALLRLAISNPYISFQLFRNDKLIFSFKAGELEECRNRFAFLVGEEFLNNSIYFEGGTKNADVFGWISRPTVSGSTAAHQMRFINSRYVRDRMVDMAVRLGFRDIMFGNRLPPYLIYLSISPSFMDVNVHPSKEEVRFANPDEIRDLIKRSIQKALSLDGFENQLQSQSFNVGLLQKSTPESYHTAKDRQHNEALTKGNTELLIDPLKSARPETKTGQSSEGLAENDLINQQGPLDLGAAIGQVHDIFIISQNPNGIIIVDMHAAHERINYEQLKMEWEENKKIASQITLVPLTLQVSEEEAETIEKTRPQLELLGFEMIRCGENRIAVHSYPLLLKEKNLEEMFSPVNSDLPILNNLERFEEEIEKTLANLACKSSLKAYDKISVKAMNALLRRIENTKNSGYCSHGRPVWRFMSISELDKIFMRGR
ncbi:MAG: DNA mismatch repair endonuclease MutL [Pseudomonadota bacterium]|nr:DNA mismatch repair endonuclease MutL [Pseudomonadota bacterium]